MGIENAGFTDPNNLPQADPRLVGKTEKLDRLTLSSVYDILIRCCGASEYEQDRTEFVQYVLDWDPSKTLEWRFQGSLGFGGKIWLYNSEVPYVNYYPEDKSKIRDQAVKKATEELAWLFKYGR